MPVIDPMCLVALVSIGAKQTAPKVRVVDARGWVTFVTQSAMMAEGKIPIANCATLSNQYISRKIKCKSDSKSVGSLINILE